MNTIYSVCGMCGTRCPIAAGVEGSEAVWIQGNPHAPAGSALCPRGIAALALEKDTERPQSPLMRVGPRGAHKWRAVGWDEALEAASSGLRKVCDAYGARSVLLSHRGGPFTDLYQAFARGLGTPNIYSHGVTCTRNVEEACTSVLGLPRDRFVIDYREARHIVVQSRNPLEALNLGEVAGITAARANGCRLTVMDVRATVTAAKADTFFLMRPGTDYAMNLAVLHVLIREQLYRPEVLPYINGFESLAERVSACTPQWAETQTGISADRIVRLVRELAEAAPRVLWYPGWFTARYANTCATMRSAYLINVLLGSIGERGGMPISDPDGIPALQRLSALYPPVQAPMADRSGWQKPGLLHRAFEAAVTGDPYPVRAYISLRHNILASLPDPDALRRRLDRLDLIIAMTTTWSPTADYADIILPMSPPLSRASIIGTKLGLKPQFFRRPQVVPPHFDTRADWEILCGLAARLGLDRLAFTRIEDIWNYQLQGTGISLSDFEAKGFVNLRDKPHWKHLTDVTLPTPSGKIEVRCRAWEEAGHDSLPAFELPPRPQAPDTFRLIPGRMALHTQASTINNPLLSDLLPENSLWLHTGRAAALGIANGDTVEVRTAAGSAGCIKVRTTTAIHPEAAFMLHGFGRSTPQESRACGKGLADEACMIGGLDREDPLGGGLALQEHFISVRRIGENA